LARSLARPIGGAIVTFGSWAMDLFFNLPIAALGVALVLRFIEDVREQGAQPLDWVGLILTGVGMAAVVWGFENIGRGPAARLGVAS